ncbi:MAG: PilZ domain-containing protein [Firmicutes bacterium]|nr:PilZ domain-containing protein [Bacillota bacterium]
MNLVRDDYLEIEIFEGFFRGEYTSRVIEADGKRLRIAIPRLGGTVVSLKEGQLIKVVLPKPDARYEFQAIVLGQNHAEPDLPASELTVERISEINRHQRRSNVRLAIKVPVELLYFYRQGIPVASYTVYSIDLSAGGVRIEIPEEFPIYTHYRVAIILPEEEVHVSAVLIRIGPLSRTEQGVPNTYWASLRFFNISETKQQKILKFIYKQQELRVKGLI